MSADYYQIEVYQYGGSHISMHTTSRQVARDRNLKTTINSIKRGLERDNENLKKHYLWATIRISAMTGDEATWGYALRFRYDTNKLYFGGLSERR